MRLAKSPEMNRILIAAAGVLILSGCAHEPEGDMTMPETFRTVEKAVEFVDAYQGEPEGLLLPVSDELQDPMGMNMAIIGESILAKGFIPDGFEQKDGFRIYKYRSMDEVNPNGSNRVR